MPRLLILTIVLIACQNAFGQNPEKRLFAIEKSAVSALNGRNFEKAYIEFSKAIKLDSSKAKYHLGKANSAFFLRKIDTAIAYVKNALRLGADEEKVKAHELLGNIYFRRKNIDAAINHFQKCISLNDGIEGQINLFNTYYNLGLCYMIQKSYSKAHDAMDNAIEIFKSSAQAYHNRGICALRLDLKESACKDFKKAAEMGSSKSVDYLKKHCE